MLKQQFLGLAILLLVAVISGEQELFSESDCNQPHTLPGATCMAKLPRYHWNNEVKICVEVTFGGCRATKNNFKTREECERIAREICVY